MSDNRPFDFASFVSANVGRVVSGCDYLRAVYKFHGLSGDFILWFAKLFWPDFKIIDGMVFIAELFDSEHYQSLLDDGRSSAEAQFWMNLLEITGLFDDLSADQAMSVAKAFTASWNSKLVSDFGVAAVLARAIYDDDTGEIFATVGMAN